MKRILICLLCVIVVFHSMAQKSDLNELEQQLSKHPQQDTFYVNRINDYLLKLSMIGASISSNQQDSLATIAYTVSKKLNYPKGIGMSMLHLAYVKTNQGDFDHAIQLEQQAEKIGKENGDQATLVYSMLLEASNYSTLNKPNEGLAILLKAEAIAKNQPNKTILARAQSALGSKYSIELANYPKAIEWLLKALHSCELANDPLAFENTYKAMGDTYNPLGDNQKALFYYNKAQHITDSLGIIEPNLLNSIGEGYRLTGKYPEAIAAYQKALKIDKTPYRTELYQSNIADVYTRMNNLPKAFEYGFVSLQGAQKINDLVGVAWIDHILSRAYLKKNMVDSALYFATAGLQAARESNFLEFLRDNSGVLANIYAEKKDFENAYKYHLQYITYRDSMNNAQVSNQANLLQYNYNMAKTQGRIDALNSDKKNQKNILIGALIVLVLIILASVLLLRNNRQKQKANKLLQQSYNNVEKLEEIGRKITSSLSVEKIISTVYTNANSLMDASVFGIGIYNDALKRIEFPATYENGKPLAFYSNSIEDKNRFASVCFNNNREIIMGDLSTDYKNYIEIIHDPHQGDQPLSVIFLPLTSKGKKLGVLTVQSFKKNAYTEYHLFMLRNIAIYTAIALENASSYQELKSTQAQLIQSEKMASLGELTAGIAHEIQNPLNFVNNFSEVNFELLEEQIEELNMGNLEVAKELSAEIAENEKKIIHHGKRADSIVKGMLQHSRSTSGQKEPTDINALCDEYLRLSYHGLRAKDKSFNVDFKTSFDESIGKINIVPQDMGRVLLNLFNNAFYACTEKKKCIVNERKNEKNISYQPRVSVSTSQNENSITITVNDNGEGIADSIKDKIFQPFFTTKPTGSGTGLGLSLSYDIVKSHGGKIKVETNQGEGTSFKITVPAA